jgi:sugar-specific transcriptional regulator TrmB
MKLSMNKELLALLSRLGLNQYESRLYLALLNTGSASASDLSDLANIPRPRTYDVLEKLEKTGFIATQPGRPTKFKALGVIEAFENLKRRKREELDKELQEIDKIAKELKIKIKTSEPLESVDVSDFVWVLRNRDNIYSRLGEILGGAQKDIIIATTENGLKRKITNYEDVLRKAKERGVKIRFIVPRETEHTKRASKLGDVVIKDHGHRFVVADDHAMLFLTPEDNERKEVGAWIKSPYFANSLRRTFS